MKTTAFVFESALESNMGTKGSLGKYSSFLGRQHHLRSFTTFDLPHPGTTYSVSFFEQPLIGYNCLQILGFVGHAPIRGCTFVARDGS